MLLMLQMITVKDNVIAFFNGIRSSSYVTFDTVTNTLMTDTMMFTDLYH